MDPILVDLVSDPPRLVYADGSWCPTTWMQAFIEARNLLRSPSVGVVASRDNDAATDTRAPHPPPTEPSADGGEGIARHGDCPPVRPCCPECGSERVQPNYIDVVPDAYVRRVIATWSCLDCEAS